MKLSWSNPSENLIHNIFIVFRSNMCIVFIKEDIIPNPPFHSSGPLLFVLSASKKRWFWLDQGSILIGL